MNFWLEFVARRLSFCKHRSGHTAVHIESSDPRRYLQRHFQHHKHATLQWEFDCGPRSGKSALLNPNGRVFGSLQSLYTSLQSNTNIAAAVTQVRDALSQVSTQRAFEGNALNQITLSESYLNKDEVNLSAEENSLIGADPVAAASELFRAQTA